MQRIHLKSDQFQATGNTKIKLHNKQYAQCDIDELNSLVQHVQPHNPGQWELVALMFQRWSKVNERPVRDRDSLRSKFSRMKSVSRLHKEDCQSHGTGTGGIEHLIPVPDASVQRPETSADICSALWEDSTNTTTPPSPPDSDSNQKWKMGKYHKYKKCEEDLLESLLRDIRPRSSKNWALLAARFGRWAQKHGCPQRGTHALECK